MRLRSERAGSDSVGGGESYQDDRGSRDDDPHTATDESDVEGERLDPSWLTEQLMQSGRDPDALAEQWRQDPLGMARQFLRASDC